jgi:hypothetical protein
MTVPNPAAAGAARPPIGRATLVKQGQREVIGGVQEVDARLAITRGLAEYIEDLQIDQPEGRRLRFKAVHEEYAEPEEQLQFPSAVVLLVGDGQYQQRGLTPALDPAERLPMPDGRYLVVPCDYVQDVSVEVWTDDVMARSQLVQLLERAFHPQFHRSGFVLELPYYFTTRATYLLKGLSIRDSADDAQRRVRVAAFTLQAQIPLITLFTFPDARPSFDLQSVGPGAEVLLSTSTT